MMQIIFHFHVSNTFLLAGQIRGITGRSEHEVVYYSENLSPEARAAMASVLGLKSFEQMIFAGNGVRVKYAHVHLVTFQALLKSSAAELIERPMFFDAIKPSRQQIEGALLEMAASRLCAKASIARYMRSIQTRAARAHRPVMTSPRIRALFTA